MGRTVLACESRGGTGERIRDAVIESLNITPATIFYRLLSGGGYPAQPEIKPRPRSHNQCGTSPQIGSVDCQAGVRRRHR